MDSQTESREPKTGNSRRRRWLVLAALLAGAGLIWARAAERTSLATFPPGAERRLLGLENGELYLADLSGVRGCLVLEAFPIGGGPSRVVFRDATPGRVGRLVDDHPNVTLRGSELLYAFGEAPPLPAVRPAAGAGTPTAPPAPSISRLHRLRLPDGTPEPFLPEVQALSLALGPEYCFWIADRGKPGSRGAGKHAYELLLTPLAGGRTRMIARLPDVVPLYPCADGVLWMNFHDEKHTLFHVRADDLEIQTISNFPPPIPPVELGERFYWVQNDPLEPFGPPVWLCSSRPDGSDPQRLVNLARNERTLRGFGPVFTSEGQLYAVVFDPSTGPTGKKMNRLCRVWPDRREPLEEIARIPPVVEVPMFFDDTRGYFLAEVKRDNWFDWSPNGLRGEPWLLLQEAWLER